MATQSNTIVSARTLIDRNAEGQETLVQAQEKQEPQSQAELVKQRVASGLYQHCK